MSSKRDVKTDVPRRIYRSTIDRIDKHLWQRPREVKSSKDKSVKGDFNKFLETMINVYEEVQVAKTHFALRLYADIETARGEAVKDAVRAKITKVEAPIEVLVIGEVE